MYDGETIPEPKNLFDDYSGRGTPAKNQEITILRSLKNRDMKLDWVNVMSDTPSDNLTPEQLKIWDEAYGAKNDAFRMSNRCAHLWSASWRVCGIGTSCLKTSQRPSCVVRNALFDLKSR